jgi:hypothetical protein
MPLWDINQSFWRLLEISLSCPGSITRTKGTFRRIPGKNNSPSHPPDGGNSAMMSPPLTFVEMPSINAMFLPFCNYKYIPAGCLVLRKGLFSSRAGRAGRCSGFDQCLTHSPIHGYFAFHHLPYIAQGFDRGSHFRFRKRSASA